MTSRAQMRAAGEAFHAGRSRRIVFLREAKAQSCLSEVVATNELRGILICKNDRGELMLCRQSADGWVQAYRLEDDGGPLTVGPPT